MTNANNKDLTEPIKIRLNVIETELPQLSSRMLQLQNDDLGIKTKTNAMDLVTNADLESEKFLKNIITKHFPDDNILAEESGLDKKESRSGFTWILDPIDGTINYAHGLPLFGISVGITYKDKPVGGIVEMPALGDRFKAIASRGAFKNGKKINVSQNNDFSKSLVVTGFPYSRKKYLKQLTDTISNIMMNARGLRRTGSAVIDICWLAEGRFDAHYELQLNAWDTCAASVILIEAGGCITNFDGNKWDIYQDNFAASNQKIHKDLIECLIPMKDIKRPEYH